MSAHTTYFLGHKPVSYDDHLARLKNNAPKYKFNEFTINGKLRNEKHRAFVAFYTKPGRPYGWYGHVLEVTGVAIPSPTPGDRLSVIIGIEYRGWTLFLTFGAGHAVVKKSRIYRTFGLVAASNSKIENGMRRLDTKAVITRNTVLSETIASGAPTSTFTSASGISSAKKVAAVNEHEKPIVCEGGVGLRYWCPETKGHLLKQVERLLEWWHNGVHTDPTMAALDKFRELDDPADALSCDAELEMAIRDISIDGFSTSLPDHYWQAVSCEFREPRQKRGSGRSVVIWDANAMRALLREGLDNGQSLHNIHVDVDLGGDSPIEVADVVDLVTWSYKDPKGKGWFIWDDGAWYFADKSWMDGVQDEMQALVTRSNDFLSDLALPPWPLPAKNAKKGEKKGEDVFVADTAAIPRTPQILGLHRKLPPSTCIQVELCDLFVDSKYLLFCKEGTGFAEVQDVCGQVLHTLRAIEYDDGFVAHFEGLLATEKQACFLRKNISDFIFSPVLAVGKRNKDPMNWSIRSQYCLVYIAGELARKHAGCALLLAEKAISIPSSAATIPSSAATNSRKTKQRPRGRRAISKQALKAAI